LSSLTRLTGLATALLWASACDPAGPQDTRAITREQFIPAFVDLRVAALRHPAGTLPVGARDSILDIHGLSPEQMLGFVQNHAAELEFMRDLWNEIEIRLDSVPPPPPDSTSASP